jgi:hypothetical protein
MLLMTHSHEESTTVHQEESSTVRQEESTTVPVLMPRPYYVTQEPARPIGEELMLALTANPRALVRFFHDKVKLTDGEIATAMGTRAGTVRRWRSAKATHAPRDVRPLDDMRVIVALLVNSGVFSLEEAGGFLRSRVVPPNDDIPLTLLSTGEVGFRRVREVAQSLVDAVLVRRDESVVDMHADSSID